MLEIVLCEDNIEFRNRVASTILETLKENCIHGDIIFECSSSSELEENLKNLNANIFILEIYLQNPEMRIELAKKIKTKIPYSLLRTTLKCTV